MTFRQRLGIFGVIFGLQVSATLIIAVAFVLVDGARAALGIPSTPLVLHAVSTFIGLVLCFGLLTVVGRFFGSKRSSQFAGMFGPIIEALSRIGRGDFNVQFDQTVSQDGIVGELAKSVTNLASDLNQMETMRQEFISNVSHEIQSPLTSIRGFARALQNEQLTDETRSHYLSIIEGESMRLSRMADNLLRLTTLDAENTRFEPKPYRLDRQIRDLILLCEPQWTAKHLDMDVSLDEITVCGDEDLLSQVWLNLIQNGIKFTPEGGSLCARLGRNSDSVEFQLKDTGIGISEDDQQHVFERFYKADKSRNRTREGSGLGLAIAHKIVTMHKGSISVASQPGTGTTFTVQLPALQ